MANEANSAEQETNCKETSEGRVKLESWLNKSMRVRMSDGRILVGMKDSHVHGNWHLGCFE